MSAEGQAVEDKVEESPEYGFSIEKEVLNLEGGITIRRGKVRAMSYPVKTLLKAIGENSEGKFITIAFQEDLPLYMEIPSDEELEQSTEDAKKFVEEKR
jgi:hypothetical protein